MSTRVNHTHFYNSTTKFTKHIQKYFFMLQVFLQQHTQHQLNYVPNIDLKRLKKGLLLLIHNKYAITINLFKIPTLTNISPFLQIILVAIQPLQP
jgi:hypothetical protein